MSMTLRDAFSVTRFSFWTGAMLSTLVGGVLYVITSRSIESDVQERFVRHAKYAQAVISMRLKSYTDLLRGAASVLQSGDTISHRQFHNYVQGLHLAGNYPAVDTLNCATWVRENQRPAFEQEFTQELQAFLGPEARPAITPPGIRPAYLVVTYIEPDATNQRLYGLDLMSNPYFRTQLAQSRDDGKLRALASSGATRSESMPRLPTAQESGVAGYDVVSWNAFFARSGTPPEIIRTLNSALQEVLSDPGIKAKMLSLGIEAKASTPEAIEDRLKSDIDKWRAVIDKAHIPKQ